MTSSSAVGENRAVVKPAGPRRLLSSRPVAASRSLTVPSYVALAMNRPSGLKSTLSPSEVSTHDWVDPMSQILTVPSSPALTTRFPRTKAEVEHLRELTTNDLERGTSCHAVYPDHTIPPAHRVAASVLAERRVVQFPR